jgi:hypothetical protein
MIPKFIHLQSHFIHLYFLTEFEIIFYIFYVMPYEKSVFKHVIKDMVKDVKHWINDDVLFSIDPSFTSQCANYQTELDDANARLWNYCVIYLGVINAILAVVFIHDVWKNYRIYGVGTTMTITSPRHNSKSNLVAFGSNHNFTEVPKTLEMSTKKNDDVVGLKSKTIEVSTKDDNSIPFHVYYWRNSGFVAEFIKTTEFIVLIGLFEYFFFVSIVDKFKIANSQTLMCDAIKAL